MNLSAVFEESLMPGVSFDAEHDFSVHYSRFQTILTIPGVLRTPKSDKQKWYSIFSATFKGSETSDGQ